MPYQILINILIKYVLPGLLVVALLGGAYYKVKGIGVAEAEAECSAAQAKREQATAKVLQSRENELALLRVQHETIIARIEDEKNKDIDHLNQSVDALRSAGLYIPKTCPRGDRGEVSTKAAGITVVAGRADRERLPPEIEEDIIALINDAQKQGVIQLKECRTRLSEFVTVIGE